MPIHYEKNTPVLKSVLLVLFLLLASHIVAENTTIDLSEKIFKIHQGHVIDLGAVGFGLYDPGDQQFKVIDWDINVVKKISLPFGEGPSETKMGVGTACAAADGQIIINGFNEQKIMHFNRAGKLRKSYRAGFFPRYVCCYGNRLLIFNDAIDLGSTDIVFMEIYNTGSGQLEKAVRFQQAPEPGEAKIEYGFKSLTIRLDKEGNIYILNGKLQSIYKIDLDGNLLGKIPLPAKDYVKATRFSKKLIVTQHIKSYSGMVIYKGTIYTLLLDLSDGYNTKIKPLDKTYRGRLFKLEMDGRFKERRVTGFYNLIGFHNGTLYLCDLKEYKVLPVKLSDFR